MAARGSGSRTCFCATPLQEERPYWKAFFEFDAIKDAHARSQCRDENGTEPWACCNCDCTLGAAGRRLRAVTSMVLSGDAT